jgi:hypothetical protein
MTFLEALGASVERGCRFRPRGEEDYCLAVRQQQWRENGKLLTRPVIWIEARSDKRRALRDKEQFSIREEMGCPVRADLLLAEWEVIGSGGSKVSLSDLFAEL